MAITKITICTDERVSLPGSAVHKEDMLASTMFIAKACTYYQRPLHFWAINKIILLERIDLTG